jgi:hypothetical protein
LAIKLGELNLDEYDINVYQKSSPLAFALDNYVNPDYSKALNTPDSDSFIIVISTDSDHCFSNENENEDKDDSAYYKFDAIYKLQLAGIKVIAVGIGNSAPVDTINYISQNGGVNYDKDNILVAQSKYELMNTLLNILDNISNCTFDITIKEEIDPYDIEIITVQDDKQNTMLYSSYCDDENGWHWVDGTAYSKIKLCPDSCTSYMEKKSLKFYGINKNCL